MSKKSTEDAMNKETASLQTKATWINRAIARLKGGDEAKSASFYSLLVKHCNKQIKVAEQKIANINSKLEEDISELEEKQLELVDVLDETVEFVDIEKMENFESRKSYIETYIENVAVADDNVAEIDTLIANLRTKASTEIAEYQKIVDLHSKILKRL